MITSYEFQEWILSYHNILDFWSVKNLHHSPYHRLIIFTKMLSWINFFWPRKQCDAIDTKENNFERF